MAGVSKTAPLFLSRCVLSAGCRENILNTLERQYEELFLIHIFRQV